ncbi:unnamed protein product [Prorocentrum cordatum]|uniref:Uncharacterized protein n=1 Tax=Prorocentrum cordatum TaxID=2364126 RepID=A0ABN9Y9J4_9DINO|nr:unnamed protein product [Polarella glacialis]|mmetsp:Transcript_2446/g.6092  ORF Transcript_2446/g.6092 Transcript_2446/m.6092 type:complete len:339 (+) Transcript_2446:506-1522(+)
MIAQHREAFSSSALRLRVDGQDRAYKFMFAQKSPVVLRVSPLEQIEHFWEPRSVDSNNWETIGLDRPVRHIFEADLFTSMGWKDLPEVAAGDISVLFGLTHTGGREVASDSTWQPLEEILRVLPVKLSAGGGGGRPRVPKDELLKLQKDFPWLEGLIGDPESNSSGTRAGGSGDDHVDLPMFEESDDEVDVLLDELRARRADWATPDEIFDIDTDFRVTLLGGKWLAMHKGKACDAFRGQVRLNTAAARWVSRCGLQKSSRYDIDKFTERGAHMCAQVWRLAMHHFFCIWMGQPLTAYAFTQADFNSWKPPQEFLDLLPGLHVQAQERAQALVRFRPY